MRLEGNLNRALSARDVAALIGVAEPSARELLQSGKVNGVFRTLTGKVVVPLVGLMEYTRSSGIDYTYIGRTTPPLCDAIEYVYFIEAVGVSRVKIGYTKNVRQRLNQLQHSTPHRLNTLLLIRGSRRLERDLHAYFKTDRVHGEWFDKSPRLTQFIDQVLAA